MYQLRIYTIATKEAAEQYFTVHWKRHIESLAKFGIKTESVFMEAGQDGTTCVIGLVSYEPGTDIEAANGAYMQSADFRKDMEGFDMRQLRGVETITLTKADYI